MIKYRWVTPVTLFTLALILPSPVIHVALAGGDTAPFASIEFWPLYLDASALGRGGATLAYADTPLAGLFNPAAMLNFPMAGLELHYAGQWADHPLNPVFQKDYNGRLRSVALRLSGAGFGLMIFRHRSFEADYEWTLDTRNSLEGTLFPAESARLDSNWESFGLNLAMRTSYDFSVGIGVRRDRFSIEGLAIQDGLDAVSQWRIRYDADESDWSYVVGAVWDMTPDIHLAFTYSWGPVVDIPVTIENLTSTEEEPATEEHRVRFGLPDVLALGFHVREGRYHLVFDARRMKTGRISRNPWLHVLTPPETPLTYKNAWDIRVGVMYEAMIGQTPVFIQFGAWNKPSLLPVWDGSADDPLAPFLSVRWPDTEKEWHWSAGIQFRLTRVFQISLAGVTGPQLKAVMLSLTTFFR